MNILVINCGSSSVKYQVIDLESGTSLVRDKVEEIGSKVKNHKEAISLIVDKVKAHKIDAIGHRVVHGGKKFSSSTLIKISEQENSYHYQKRR